MSTVRTQHTAVDGKGDDDDEAGHKNIHEKQR